ELTSLFIEENLKAREQMAENTSQFIDTEVDSARKNLAAQEEKLKESKSQSTGELPEQQQTNLQILSQLQVQLQANTEALNRLHEEDVYLKNLISERESLIAKDDGQQPKASEIAGELKKARSVLQDLQGRYTDRHPDVVKMKAEVARLETQLKGDEAITTQSQAATTAKRSPASDPTLTQARSQLEALHLSTKARSKRQEEIEAEIHVFQQRVKMAPLREQQ